MSEPYERAAEIPPEQLHVNEASGWASRTVITAAIMMIIGLVLICMIGPHIPGGE